MEKPEIPCGYRFNPTPQEILQYLSYKADGGILHKDLNCAIKEIDLRTVQDPGRLFEWGGKDCNVVYTFTKWDEIFGKLLSIPVAGDGCWVSLSGPTEVLSTYEHRGSRRCMGWFRPRTFKPVEKGNQDYAMKEFSLNKEFEGYVVCEIRKEDRWIKPSKSTTPEYGSPQSYSTILPRTGEYEKSILDDYPISPVYFVDGSPQSNSTLLPGTEEYEKSILDDYPISPVYFVDGSSCIDYAGELVSVNAPEYSISPIYLLDDSSCIDYAGKVTPVNAPPLDNIECLPLHPKKMKKPSIPLGYRFDPTREDLIEYLSCKAMGKSLPHDGAIKEIDLSSPEDLGKLFEGKSEECKVLYAFAELNKLNNKRNASGRKVGKTCSWISQGTCMPVFGTKEHNRGKCIGFSSYHLARTEKGNYSYTMHQFTLENDTLSCAMFEDCVLCQIMRSNDSNTKSASSKERLR